MILSYERVFKNLIKGCKTEEERVEVREAYKSLLRVSGSTQVEVEEAMRGAEEEIMNDGNIIREA